MSVPMMSLDAVTAGYGRAADALHGVSVEFFQGVTLITGPNGSGKSTLLEVLASNVLPRAGVAKIGSSSVLTAQTRMLRNYVPHEVGLIPALTLREHLLLAAPADDADAVATEVKQWGLDEWVDAPTENLSTGNRRKAWLLVCLLDRTDCILLDEPFNGLDADSVEHLTMCIREWIACGSAVVLASHTMPSLIETLKPRVLHMREGRVDE
ncbi:ATP-binding cassette domain-containing protein [Microbacterium sp. NPDC076768]|uniref:ABC transporter ATP-binding protein n=1 Tax=Microbacterium sp. NPDC076768 TaxID=3154858 RepID=UPI00343DD297